MFPSHPKRLMNERRPGDMVSGLRGVGLDFTNEAMPLPVGRGQRIGQAWYGVDALLEGVWSAPAISPHHLTIRSCRIRAKVKQKEYGHTPPLAA